MTTFSGSSQSQRDSLEVSIQPKLESMIDELITSLPDPEQVARQERGE